MSTMLYVSNLPLTATAEALSTRFREFGNVLSVALQPQRRVNRRGAFVEMVSGTAAQKAIAALNLSEFDGRLVSVYLALARVSEKPS